MKYLYNFHLFTGFIQRSGPRLFLFLCMLSGITGQLYAGEDNIRVVEVKLGDYSYMPGEIQLVAEQPVILRLTNTDLITPHDFILEDPRDGLDTSVDVPAGKSVDVYLMPMVPGTHTFYCSKKLLFMDSHREKGMEGQLIIEPK